MIRNGLQRFVFELKGGHVMRTALHTYLPYIKTNINEDLIDQPLFQLFQPFISLLQTYSYTNHRIKDISPTEAN